MKLPDGRCCFCPQTSRSAMGVVEHWFHSCYAFVHRSADACVHHFDEYSLDFLFAGARDSSLVGGVTLHRGYAFVHGSVEQWLVLVGHLGQSKGHLGREIRHLLGEHRSSWKLYNHHRSCCLGLLHHSVN
jgi:hypothetical protein